MDMPDHTGATLEQTEIVHVHLIAASTNVRTIIGPVIASKYGGVFCHDSVADFQISVPADDWGVVLLEVPEENRVDGAELIRQTHPGFRLVVTAQQPEVNTVIEALRAGASDFFPLPAPTPAVIDALTRALRKAWSGHVVRQQSVEADRRLRTLTRRESDVLELLVTGETSKQIARELGLSHRTVEYFRARVFAKTGVDSIADLMRMYAAARAWPDFQTGPHTA
ncbi:MAG: response regulator transcription factor [Glycocaulis sp.]